MQSDRVDELYSKLLSRSKDFAELWFRIFYQQKFVTRKYEE